VLLPYILFPGNNRPRINSRPGTKGTCDRRQNQLELLRRISLCRLCARQRISHVRANPGITRHKARSPRIRTQDQQLPAHDLGNQPAGGPQGAQQHQQRYQTPPPAVVDPQGAHVQQPRQERPINIAETLARRTGMPILEEYPESIASTTSTVISLPRSYKSVVALNPEPFARWLKSPFVHHDDLAVYLEKPVRTLTSADHTRISRFMDVVLNANTEDEIYVAIHATPYMSFLLTDMSTRLQRAYQQGYTRREMESI
jgi:hypothetical protein